MDRTDAGSSLFLLKVNITGSLIEENKIKVTDTTL